MKQSYVVQDLADEYGVVTDARLVGSRPMKTVTGSVTLDAEATSLSIPSPANAHVVTVLPDKATAEAIKAMESSCVSALLFTDLLAVDGISQTPGLVVKQIRAGNGSLGSCAIASANLSSPPVTASTAASVPFAAGTYEWTAFCFD